MVALILGLLRASRGLYVTPEYLCSCLFVSSILTSPLAGLFATFIPCFLFGKTQARLDNPTLQNFNYCNGDVGFSYL